MCELKKCSNCSELKELIEFNKNKKKKDGVASLCKICHSKYRKEHYLKNKDKVIEQVKNYKLNNPILDDSHKMNRYSKKAGRTIEVKCEKCGFIIYQSKTDLLLNKKAYCSQKCKSIDNKSDYYFYLKEIEKRAIKTNKNFDLTEEFLKDLLENKQKNKCAITNISIVIKSKKDNTSIYGTASLDRIDSNIGYIKNNVQWVCLGINYMKLNYSDNELHIMLKLIKENYTGDRLGVGGDSKSFT